MLKTFFSFMFIMAFSVTCIAQSQDSVSLKIANKMKAALQLDAAQYNGIYDINRQLTSLKAAARQQHGNQPDVLQTKFQQIENTRDSLYRPVLGEQTYLLYREKKRELVNNN